MCVCGVVGFVLHGVFCFNQDEYEELLRHAVVTPKFEPSTPSQLLQMSQLSGTGHNSHLMVGRRSQCTEGVKLHFAHEWFISQQWFYNREHLRKSNKMLCPPPSLLFLSLWLASISTTRGQWKTLRQRGDLNQGNSSWSGFLSCPSIRR